MAISLNKNSLIPGEKYNVSISLKGTSKTIDNLRFFQTELPKVFTTNLGSFNTLSTITNTVSRQDTQTSDGTEPGPLSKSVSNIKISTQSVGGGPESTIPNVNNRSFDFEIISNAPKTMYALSDFTGKFKFLNNISGVKVAGSIIITVPYSQFAPGAQYSKSKMAWVKGTGSQDEVDTLNWYIKHKDNTDANGKVNYFGGKYTAPTIKSTFTRVSNIKTNIRNPSILESLVWSDEVKDYIYFFISSSSTGPWYYFKANEDIVPTSVNKGEIIGTSGTRSPSLPKTITSAEFNSLQQSDYLGGAHCTFFRGSKTAVETFGVPNVYVRFGVARYILDSATNTVEAKWLPDSSNDANKLSAIEHLDGY